MRGELTSRSPPRSSSVSVCDLARAVAGMERQIRASVANLLITNSLLQFQKTPLLRHGNAPHRDPATGGDQDAIGVVVAEPVFRVVKPRLIAEGHSGLHRCEVAQCDIRGLM